jgi:hypothetical protein
VCNQTRPSESGGFSSPPLFERRGSGRAGRGGECVYQRTSVKPKAYKPFDPYEKMALKLQRIIIQTVSCMFKHGIITPNQLSHFFKINHNLEIAAFNMIATFKIEYGTELFYPKYPTVEFILKDEY